MKSRGFLVCLALILAALVPLSACTQAPSQTPTPSPKPAPSPTAAPATNAVPSSTAAPSPKPTPTARPATLVPTTTPLSSPRETAKVPSIVQAIIRDEPSPTGLYIGPARFILKEGRDRTILVVREECGEPFIANYNNDRIYRCPGSEKSLGFMFPMSIAIVENQVIYVPLRALREDLSLDFAISDKKVYIPLVPGAPFPQRDSAGEEIYDPQKVKVITTTVYYLGADGVSAELVPGSDVIEINGTKRQMAGAVSTTEGGIIAVPLKDLAEVFKCKVDWEASSRSIVVRRPYRQR